MGELHHPCMRLWEWLMQTPLPGGGATPAPPLAITLPEPPKSMSTPPDWAAVAVFVSVGLFATGAIGAAVKAAFRYLSGMSVTLSSILNELKSLGQWATKADSRMEAFGKEIHELRVDLHDVKGVVNSHDHRLGRIEEKDS